MTEKILDGYCTKYWPDDESCIEDIDKKFKEYLEANPEVLASKDSFRIAGFGCGPSANIETVKTLVDNIKKINEKKEIEIYFVDFSNNVAQLNITKEALKRYEGIYVYATNGDFYNRVFSENFLDLAFGFSTFCYPPNGFKQPENYHSICYNGRNPKREDLDASSLDCLKKIFDNLNVQVKSKGLVIVVEFGGAKTDSQELQTTCVFFDKLGYFIKKKADEHQLVVENIPLFFRNIDIYESMIKDDKYPYDVLFYKDLIDHNSFYNYIYKTTNGDQKLIDQINLEMNTSCSKPYLSNNQNKELVDKAFSEAMSEWMKLSNKEQGFQGGLCGNIVIFKKK